MGCSLCRPCSRSKDFAFFSLSGGSLGGLWAEEGWHGVGWDGMAGDGMGWDVLRWDGMGRDEMGWDGVGWDGMGWHGMAWPGAYCGEEAVGRRGRSWKPSQEGTRVTWVRDGGGSERRGSSGGAERRFSPRCVWKIEPNVLNWTQGIAEWSLGDSRLGPAQLGAWFAVN